MSKRMEPTKRKELILNIAKELFSKKGYYETQIHDIVIIAEISRGTIYQYFKNKDDIYMTLLDNFFNKWEKQMKKGLIDLEELELINPVEYFRLRIKQSLSFFAEDHHMTNIILRNAPGIGGNFEVIVKKLEKKIKALISDDIKMGINNGFVKKEIDVDMASELIAGGVTRIAFIYFIKNKNNKSNLSLDELSIKITDLFTSGLYYCHDIPKK